MAMRHVMSVLVVCAALLWKPVELQNTTLCSRPSPCLFDCAGTTLDLTPLSRDDQKPVFPDVTDSQGQSKFSFSPCTSFSEGSGCVNTSVCQMPDILNTSNTIDVGSTGSVVLSENTDTNTAFLTYTHSVGGVTKTTVVTLVCANNGKQANGTGTLSVAGEAPASSGNYHMTLTSQYACFQSTDNNTTTEPPVVTTTSESNTTSESSPTTESPANTTSHLNGTTSESETTSQSGTTSQSNVTTEPTTNPGSSVTTGSSSYTSASTVPSTTPGGHASALRCSMLFVVMVAATSTFVKY